MRHGIGIWQMNRTYIRIRMIRFALAVVVAAGISAFGFAIESASALACDVTSGASCKVLGIKTTSTSATISWTEKEHGSSRYFCYGIGSPSNCAKVTSRAKGSKDQVVSGLTPQTKYAFKFYGVHSGKTLSVVNGSFTTIEGFVCGSSVITTVEVDGIALNEGRDSVENVIAQIARKTDGIIVDKDTTNTSGTFHFNVPPGTYIVTLSAPPYTPPAPYTATVIINKPLTIPDRIFMGAFNVTGTVVTPGNLDSIAGATVTLNGISDPTVSFARVTDINGHFSFGAKPGNYSVNVKFNGRSLSAPVAISVSGNLKIPNLVIDVTTGLRDLLKTNGSAPRAITGLEGYDIRGAKKKATPGVEVKLIP